MTGRILLIAVVMGIILHVFTIAASAENEAVELENEIETYQQQQTEMLEEEVRTEEYIGEVGEAAAEIQREIRLLDEEMQEIYNQILVKEHEIETTNEDTRLLREEIILSEERIASRDEVLKDRMKSMHQSSGGVQYIEVILGAQGFGDLIERVSALRNITRQDRAVLDAHVEDMETLDTARQALNEELQELETQVSELEELQENLAASNSEKRMLLEELEEQGYILEDHLLSLSEERSLLEAQEEAAKQELAAWEEEQRRLEEERIRLEEERLEAIALQRQEEIDRAVREEAAAAEQAAEETEKAEVFTVIDAADSIDITNLKEASSSFHRPADGRITSPYDKHRMHPVHHTVRAHNGTDFGGEAGLNIYAAEAGTVFSAGWMNGFGNTIMLSHNINGKEYTTLYAHLAAMDAAPGDRVERGEVIATMGTTGVSTGIHLHFEVHPGGYAGSSSAVNPAKYLP